MVFGRNSLIARANWILLTTLLFVGCQNGTWGGPGTGGASGSSGFGGAPGTGGGAGSSMLDGGPGGTPTDGVAALDAAGGGPSGLGGSAGSSGPDAGAGGTSTDGSGAVDLAADGLTPTPQPDAGVGACLGVCLETFLAERPSVWGLECRTVTEGNQTTTCYEDLSKMILVTEGGVGTANDLEPERRTLSHDAALLEDRRPTGPRRQSGRARGVHAQRDSDSDLS
jgi:hypothetical protein